MKKEKYRCSCCNKVKQENDKIQTPWSFSSGMDVMICAHCADQMSKSKIKYVLEYINRKLA